MSRAVSLNPASQPFFPGGGPFGFAGSSPTPGEALDSSELMNHDTPARDHEVSSPRASDDSKVDDHDSTGDRETNLSASGVGFGGSATSGLGFRSPIGQTPGEHVPYPQPSTPSRTSSAANSASPDRLHHLPPRSESPASMEYGNASVRSGVVEADRGYPNVESHQYESSYTGHVETIFEDDDPSERGRDDGVISPTDTSSSSLYTAFTTPSSIGFNTAPTHSNLPRSVAATSSSREMSSSPVFQSSRTSAFQQLQQLQQQQQQLQQQQQQQQMQQHQPPHSLATSFHSTASPSAFGPRTTSSSFHDNNNHSTGGGGMAATSANLEPVIKTSPYIADIVDRLARTEYAQKELNRDLMDVAKKVDFLVDRALAQDTQNQNANRASGFLPGSSMASNSLQQQSSHMSVPSAPASDDIRQLSQRLNTLTTSVGQLLALQTQQHMQNVNSGFSPNGSGIGSSSINSPNDLRSNLGMGTPSGSTTPQIGGPLGTPGSGIHHGLPNRPGDIGSGGIGARPPPRTTTQRTWSSSSLDGVGIGVGGNSIRNSQLGSALAGAGLGSGDPSPIGRAKRGGVGNLMRRDSGSSMGDSMGGSEWGGNQASREGGPVISKWEHLPLLPDLLRSIAKYGVGPPNKIQQRALPFLLKGADIIAQAPPTQERIAAYVIPAIHVALTNMVGKAPNRGPLVVIISTTVDQATQAQRMIRDLGGSIGVRSALGVGTGGDVVQELRLLQQSMPHILCGTPQKLHALFTSPNGLSGSEVRFLVLDEVDQLIARNLNEFVFNIVKLFPTPKSTRPGASGGGGGSITPSASPAPGGFSPFEVVPTSGGFSAGGAANSPSLGAGSPFPGGPGSRFNPSPNPTDQPGGSPTSTTERQTALFSNTVPQDVLNLAHAIQLREPVRVLVRRDGNVTHADTNHGARGLRQFYLYLAFTAGGGARGLTTPSETGGGLGIIGSGRGATSAETNQAREWKLDALADLFDDIEVGQAIVHVGGMNSLESVVYKLASRGLEAVPLHSDMNAGTKLAALNKFRGSQNMMMRQTPGTRVLVVYDVQVKAPDVFQVPLVINYDLPKAVEEYAHRVAPAISSSYSRAGVVINFVTATGGDVEMLRSIECFYKIKCPEVPMSLRDVI